MNKKVYFGVLAGTLAVLFLITGIIYFAVSASLSDICGTLELEGLEEDYDDVINVLAIGVDGGGTRSDTMLLVSLNTKENEVSLMSIPRDTRVPYDGSWDKITHLFTYDSTGQLTVDAVKEITGAEINYVAILNFNGFTKVIDALGGVEVDVPNINNGGMYYDDPVQDLHIALPAGRQLLNGEEAQGFVRYRSGYATADLGRVETQRYFISELIDQKLNFGYVTKIPGIISALEGDLVTNYSCMDLVSQAFGMLGTDSESINSYTLPGQAGMASTRYGMASCFMYDEEETAALISEYFSE